MTFEVGLVTFVTLGLLICPKNKDLGMFLSIQCFLGRVKKI